MLQDLAFGHLDNQYRDHQPRGADVVVCIRGGSILVRRDRNDVLTLPDFARVSAWSRRWICWPGQPFRYAFTMQNIRFFLWMGEGGEPEDPSFAYEPASGLRQAVSRDVCFAAMTAWHLYCWYRDSRFCGRCGTATLHDGKERMMRCPACGNMIFPKIDLSIF